jgi:UDPglucose 6-dehydrogenase
VEIGFMDICIVGTGYVGLVTGTCFADSGNRVVCVDTDERKIGMLKRGEIPIYEPGLEEMVKRNAHEGRLRFTTDLGEAVRQSTIIFIAVGTPPGEDGSADLQYVRAAARGIASHMNGYKVIVDKSTVPVGTGAKVREDIAANTQHPFEVVSNPEFLKEGAAIEDFTKPDRVVVGIDADGDSKARELMLELYSPFVRTENPILFMDVRSAEMTKYVANAMLATKISFINEMANLCERLGADVNDVRKGIGYDKRIGFQFIHPGVGYGGSCFPKDVKAIVQMGEKIGYPLTLMPAVEAVNEKQKSVLFEKVKAHFAGELAGRHLAVWGLSFKPKTDDMREAPSIVIVEKLLAAGATVAAHDPVAMPEAKKHFGDKIRYAADPYSALDGADALLLVTEWNEFRLPNFDDMKSRLRMPVVFDGRNLYSPRKMALQGFIYHSIGREPLAVDA